MNALFGNVYLIDSGGLWLTNNSAENGEFLDLRITGARFVSGTSGEFVLTAQSQTALNVVLRFRNVNNNADLSVDFSTPFQVREKVFVRTVTTGTGWLYLA